MNDPLVRDLLVRDLMTAEVFTVGPDDSIAKVRDLMERRAVRRLPVVNDHGELVGLVSYRDLLRRSLIEGTNAPPIVEQEAIEHTPVHEVMKVRLHTTEPDAELREAAQLMLDHKCACLPVVEGRHLVGIITQTDFVRRLIAEAEIIPTPPTTSP